MEGGQFTTEFFTKTKVKVTEFFDKIDEEKFEDLVN
jgi:hypothetical protein